MTARTENAARGLAYQGIDPRKVGMDWREYREKQREDSVRAAKADILLDEIARREGIEATDAEVDAEMARFARAREEVARRRCAARWRRKARSERSARGSARRRPLTCSRPMLDWT